MTFTELRDRMLSAQAGCQLVAAEDINADDALSEAYAHIDNALSCLARAERLEEARLAEDLKAALHATRHDAVRGL